MLRRLQGAIAGVCLLAASCGGSGSDASCGGTFTACGGSVVGDWNVTDICLENPGALLADQLNAPACKNAIRSVHVDTSGSYSFRADGTATTSLKESVSFSVLLTSACVSAIAMQSVTISPQACSSLQSTYQSDANGFAMAGCSFAQGGCLCSLTTMTQDVPGGGAYTVKGNSLLTGSAAGDPYCVKGDTLQISVSESGLTGTIVLQRK